jgi:molybdopterin/thiamine biosynthesis adenylyltransferase/rhodanese-related sulfurtransferase
MTTCASYARSPVVNGLTREAALRRYARQIIVPQIGLAGQQKLAASRVLCVGAGGLGSAVLPYLVAAGVGRVGIVEFDTVDLTNVHRQVLYTEEDAGQKKLRAACRRLHAINSSVAIDPIPLRLDATNARELVGHYDLVIDGTDNIPTRYLLNDACFFERRPLVYAAISQFDGQLSVFARDRGACYRCLFPTMAEVPPNCAEAGVLGILPGILGALQANEAFKILLDMGEPLYGLLLSYGALDNDFTLIHVPKDPSCRLCGDEPTIFSVQPIRTPDAHCEIMETRVPATELGTFLKQHPDVRLLDLRDGGEAPEGIAESINIPATELTKRLDELSPSMTYLVACAVGVQSLWAIGVLRRNGFSRLLHLEGGMNLFLNQSLAVGM